MPGMISERRGALARQKQLDVQAPKAGDPASDFELSDSDGQNPVGLDGKVAYAGGLGPFGFKPAELEAAIETDLTTADSSPT